MVQVETRDGIDSSGIELAELGRSTSLLNHEQQTSSSRSNSCLNPKLDNGEVDSIMQWSVIERLPTIERLRTSLIDAYNNGESERGKAKRKKIVDVSKLEPLERQMFIDKLIKNIEKDNLLLLQKLRERMDRMTLLLGPPGCGKTTLLMALSAKLDQSLKVTGEISYNGHKLNEFIPQKTSAYISQHDLHIPEMTVRETLDFSACCQGVGSRSEIMMEVIRREKEAGIIPDTHLDAYMKGISVGGLENSLQTDYILKILGLDICAETMVGNALRRGISGGQKKRLTTGEMIVGPSRVLFMDEISNGLDSASTLQIVSYVQHLVHITEATAVVSLLQPAPETYDLFDDVILMAEGKIVYHGPCARVLDFFEDCGFKCTERKGTADYLQEVISKKDQKQYWYRSDEPYSYISVDQFSKKFKSYQIGKELDDELSVPYDKLQCPKYSLCFRKYSLTKWELLKACLKREILLMRRNSFVYVIQSTRLVITALITMTVFLRSRMKVDVVHANDLLGSLFFALIILIVDGMPEIFFTVSNFAVFYKQKQSLFYPAWAYAIPAAVLKIPVSVAESVIWTALTYYVIGYSPEFGR
ncbi:hypothetical protein Syun_008188 [Stephania yunnanensis]|uniref:ABC transporter domain-containing protein n=1 Tax=Stephania yunnanensis TaxID=152371 RepID=A0AAP0KZU5_9MAGN